MRRIWTALFGVAGFWTAHAAAGEFVTLTTAYGTHLEGYVAGAEDAPRGIVLFHDKYGFDKHVRNWAERFAGEGYRVLAVDLFDGRASNSAARGRALVRSADPAAVQADVQAAIRYLQQRGRKIAAVGWDYGAQQALNAAILEPRGTDAVVMYYGNPVTDEKLLRPLDQGILLILAGRDPRLTSADAGVFRTALASSNVRLTVISVDADRGFADRAERAYDPQAEATAWQTVLGFLEKELVAEATSPEQATEEFTIVDPASAVDKGTAAPEPAQEPAPADEPTPATSPTLPEEPTPATPPAPAGEPGSVTEPNLPGEVAPPAVLTDAPPDQPASAEPDAQQTIPNPGLPADPTPSGEPNVPVAEPGLPAAPVREPADVDQPERQPAETGGGLPPTLAEPPNRGTGPATPEGQDINLPSEVAPPTVPEAPNPTNMPGPRVPPMPGSGAPPAPTMPDDAGPDAPQELPQ